MSATGRMGVGLVGDSPAASVFALALAGAGHTVIGRSLPPEDRADSLDALLPGVAVWDVERVVSRSELVLLAAEGEALEAVVKKLVAEEICQQGQLVCHLDYRRGIDVLTPLVSAGVIPLWMYPLVPLSGTSVDLVRLADSWCAVAAPTPVLPIAQALAIEVGMEPLVIQPAQHDAFVRSIDAIAAISDRLVVDATADLERAGVERATPALGSLLRHAIDQATSHLGQGAPRD